ncbi:putative lipoprotein [Treponema primitia ZAS-2]|uniref:Putative lipoprotein n=1 Tax=Treponema primitia (strain ATCC BAA-887 / DSM 12427 / ZAS-2) TaxID=545694 RepID=F5YQM1_TREPZ|nr:hypothetical protein [Treponema primitia]AEF85781.1 putative lipoprotein [Treponema primitia ZAS-2]
MKSRWYGWMFFAVLTAGLLVSCMSTGEYKPISQNVNVEVIGTVQTTFISTPGFSKEPINIQAYIKLLEEAHKRYEGNIDVGDIIWTTSRTIGNSPNYEFAASGKVILNRQGE